MLIEVLWTLWNPTYTEPLYFLDNAFNVYVKFYSLYSSKGVLLLVKCMNNKLSVIKIFSEIEQKLDDKLALEKLC